MRTGLFSIEYRPTGSSEPSTSQGSHGVLGHDISFVTRLRSEPHRLRSRTLTGELTMPISPVRMLACREGNISGHSRFSSADRCHVLSRFLPVDGPRLIDRMSNKVFVSHFSGDGSLFVAAVQGTSIRIYDVDRGWYVQNDIPTESIAFPVIDACLSPDQQFLVYADRTPTAKLVNIGSIESANTSPESLTIREPSDDDDAIFSIKFSPDGQELVAANMDASIYVYDLGANRLSGSIPAHMSDVNTVCFADDSGHVIYSGSDDSLCKVMDRRCFTTSGVLAGHMEGVTFIDSRGDCRHLISNGKDQTLKLWDIRKMSSNVPKYVFLPPISNVCSNGKDQTLKLWDIRKMFSNVPKNPCKIEVYNYRWMEYPDRLRNTRHPNDMSLATFRGHSVLKTQIHCYFSPAYSTGQKYIYTGSADESVYIFDMLTGARVAKLEYHRGVVRDCSWHPYNPSLVSSSWDGIVAKWDASRSL